MKYTIPTYKLKTITKKLEELNNRILGMDGIRIDYMISPSYQKDIIFKNDDDVDVHKMVEVNDIDVINPVVSLNGWSFLAITEHSKNGNIIMKKIYDVEIPEQYWNSDTYCEHCNTDRYRKYTYLVYRADTKEIHQVGSTCLTAYLGFDASLLLSHATLFNTLNDMMDKEHGKMYKRGVEVQNIEMFLKRTIACVQKHGYISAKMVRKDAEENRENVDHNYLSATGDIVWGIEYNKKYWQDELNTAASDGVDKTYKHVIEWVNGLENTSDYIRNIKGLIAREYITYKTATTAASIVGVYFMNLNKKKVEDKTISNHFGNIGERIDVDMVLISKRVFDSQYGTSNCYMFKTINDNVAVWFTKSVNLEVDGHYTGKATVTKHTEYKGLKQTVINRCNLVEVE